MRRVLMLATAAFALAVSAAVSGSPEPGQTPTPRRAAGASAPAPPPIDTYCVACHNQRVKTAGIAFDNADLRDVSKDGELWEKALRKLRGGMMPPPGARRPDAAAVDAFTSGLER